MSVSDSKIQISILILPCLDCGSDVGGGDIGGGELVILVAIVVSPCRLCQGGRSIENHGWSFLPSKHNLEIIKIFTVSNLILKV